jgi:hypothetical protein
MLYDCKDKKKKTKRKYCEMEQNSSKDRAMHEGDNPLYWNEFIKFD